MAKFDLAKPNIRRKVLVYRPPLGRNEAHETGPAADSERGAVIANVPSPAQESQAASERHGSAAAQSEALQVDARARAYDLGVALDGSDVAMIVLDTQLHLRSLTLAAKALFAFDPAAIGKPVAAIGVLGPDATLTHDAWAVLASLDPLAREIEIAPGVWMLRRIVPYRSVRGRLDGLIISYDALAGPNDAARQLADSLQRAREAEQATLEKSKSLSAANHELRQPLQTLALLQALLLKAVTGEAALRLVAQVDSTVRAMSGILDALLDIEHSEDGVVPVQRSEFAIDDLLERMRSEFSYHAQARGLTLRVVPSRVRVTSDPRLLEQMVRNLLANALKYTSRGKVLLGCRRRAGLLAIEVWDTGTGIPADQLDAIFQESVQLGNPTHDRDRGLGLGLYVAKRFGARLGYKLYVRSALGLGSVFSIEGLSIVPQLMPSMTGEPGETGEPISRSTRAAALAGLGRETQSLPLASEHVSPGSAARPDTGPSLTRASASALARVGINASLYQVVAVPLMRLTPKSIRAATRPEGFEAQRRIAIAMTTIDGHPRGEQLLIGTGSSRVLCSPFVWARSDGRAQHRALPDMVDLAKQLAFGATSANVFCLAHPCGRVTGHWLEAYLAQLEWAGLLMQPEALGPNPPIQNLARLFYGPVAPLGAMGKVLRLLPGLDGEGARIRQDAPVPAQAPGADDTSDWRRTTAQQIARLTPRQIQIMNLVLAGHPSKNIAQDLQISQRTVENHRASIMKRTHSRSLPELARMAFALTWNGTDDPRHQDRSLSQADARPIAEATRIHADGLTPTGPENPAQKNSEGESPGPSVRAAMVVPKVRP